MELNEKQSILMKIIIWQIDKTCLGKTSVNELGTGKKLFIL